jgi:type II secretory pathway component PulF
MPRWLNIFLTAVAMSLLVVATMAAYTWDDYSFLFPVVFILLGVSLTFVLWTLGLSRLSSTRTSQRNTVILTYIEQAIRLNLPLNRALLAAEASEPRWIRSNLAKLRKQLDSGSSISAAIKNTLPGTSRRNLALLENAERVGQLGPELSFVLQAHPSSQDALERSFLRTYPLTMIVVIIGIVSMISIFVLPKYIQIFHDFRFPLPALTAAVLQFTDTPWAVETLFGLLFLAAITVILFRRWQWFDLRRWFTTSRDLADVCRTIARAMRLGVALPSAIRSATDLALRRGLRSRLNRWAAGIEAGMAGTDAAYAADLPRLIAGLCTSIEGFEFLTRYYAGKFSRLVILLRAAAVPLVVFFFGLLVAIVALTLFLPLVGLIDAAAKTTGFL